MSIKIIENKMRKVAKDHKDKKIDSVEHLNTLSNLNAELQPLISARDAQVEAERKVAFILERVERKRLRLGLV